VVYVGNMNINIK